MNRIRIEPSYNEDGNLPVWYAIWGEDKGRADYEGMGPTVETALADLANQLGEALIKERQKQKAP